MKIEIEKLIPGMLAAKMMRYLWGAKCEHLDDRHFASDHSILLMPTWVAFCEAPRSVALQMETHKKKDGFYLWMASARPDRDAEAAKEYSRDQTVRFVMMFSAAAMKHISHLRMCNMAERPTQDFVFALRDNLLERGDRDSLYLARHMMPMCAYRNGICGEPRGCGLKWTYDNWVNNN